MKKIYLLIATQFIFLLSFSQEIIRISDTTSQNSIIVDLDEFKNIFYKNNNSAEVSLDYLDEYMELYIKFKLKVIEAQSLGYDTLKKFKTELEGYRKQLAKPYLRNKDFDKQMLSEAYQRMQFDINASHILIALSQESTKDQEKNAYDKAIKIRNSILNKELDFADAAKKFSDDQSAKYNDGNLGYFTAFMMVYDFESAAYNTNVGNISLPVKTKFGYHLIKVNDKRKAVGNVKVAHIMFKTAKDASEDQINEAYQKAVNAMNLLKDGDDFADVAERFSEDKKTAVNGGILPEFGVGKMVSEFENNAFSLQNIGDISQPFKTDFGWHIIKLVDKKPIPSFKNLESELKLKIERDSRSQLSTQALYEKLQNEYKVINKPSTYADFRKKSNSAIKNGTFKIELIDNTELFKIDGESVTINEFAEYIVQNQAKSNDIDQLYIDFVNVSLLSYEDSKLEEKYPEYKAILNEYKEGILLFDITSDNVWNRAIDDTLGMQIFFDLLSYKYTWPERLNATIYTCIDQVTANKVLKNINGKNKKSLGWTMSNRSTQYSVEELLKLCNTEKPLSLQVENNNFVRGENKFIDEVSWKKGAIKKIELNNNNFIIIEIHDILSPSEKTLDETKGKVIADYQNFLEKVWIHKLRFKYKIDIDFNVLYSLSDVDNEKISNHKSSKVLTSDDFWSSYSDNKLWNGEYDNTYYETLFSNSKLLSELQIPLTREELGFVMLEWQKDQIDVVNQQKLFEKLLNNKYYKNKKHIRFGDE